MIGEMNGHESRSAGESGGQRRMVISISKHGPREQVHRPEKEIRDIYMSSVFQRFTSLKMHKAPTTVGSIHIPVEEIANYESAMRKAVGKLHLMDKRFRLRLRTSDFEPSCSTGFSIGPYSAFSTLQ